MSEQLCHCGQPLHYSDPVVRKYVERMVERHGPTVIITVGGRSFKVPRHYIALHGIKGNEVADLGFEEIIDDERKNRAKE